MRKRKNKRVAAGNNKGGTGKSGWVANVAAALADEGCTVLVVDVDPQANVSRRLGRPYRKEEPLVTTAEVIKSGEVGAAADGIVPCGWSGIYAERIHIIPSRFDLENRISEAAVIGSRGRLARALEGVDDDYDFTLFDCQPSLGHLTQLALAAARWGVALVEPEYDGVEGAVRFRDFIASEVNRKEMGNLDLAFAAAIPSMVDGRLAGHAHHLTSLPGIFGESRVWESIPRRSVIKDAADEAQPLADQGSRGNEMREVYKTAALRMIKEFA
ncbi:ParA family protein [Streptomyces chartreusis]|uniref:ParA family protein n=1 Tax=Streptomyces chartreusis TaxID=1969 RepID=UPI0036AACEA9